MNGKRWPITAGCTLALLIMALMWVLSQETPAERQQVAKLPFASMQWLAKDVPITDQHIALTASVAEFVAVTGHLVASDGWSWSPLCNISCGRMYPKGVMVPEVLPKNKLAELRDRRSKHTFPKPGTSRVVRLAVRLVPEGLLTPSELAEQPVERLSTYLELKRETAFYGGLIQMPEEPGKYWLQLLCEFNTDETYDRFVPFFGEPIAEVPITVGTP